MNNRPSAKIFNLVSKLLVCSFIFSLLFSLPANAVPPFGTPIPVPAGSIGLESATPEAVGAASTFVVLEENRVSGHFTDPLAVISDANRKNFPQVVFNTADEKAHIVWLDGADYNAEFGGRFTNNVGYKWVSVLGNEVSRSGSLVDVFGGDDDWHGENITFAREDDWTGERLWDRGSDLDTDLSNHSVNRPNILKDGSVIFPATHTYVDNDYDAFAVITNKIMLSNPEGVLSSLLPGSGTTLHQLADDGRVAPPANPISTLHFTFEDNDAYATGTDLYPNTRRFEFLDTALGANNALHMVWEYRPHHSAAEFDAISTKIMYAVRNSSGRTRTPIEISPAGRTPSLAVANPASGPVINIVYLSAARHDLMLHRRGAGTGSSEYNLRRSDNYLVGPKVGATSDGSLHILYKEGASTLAEGNSGQLKYLKVSPDGQVITTTNIGGAISYDLAVYNDIVHIVYNDATMVYYRYKSDLQSDWSAVIRVGDQVVGAAYLSMSVDDLGNTHIVWRDRDGDDYKIMYVIGDNTPPTAPTITGIDELDEDSYSTSNVLHVRRGNSSDLLSRTSDLIYRAYLDGVRVGPGGYNPLRDIADGAHSLRLRAYDPAGNWSASAPLSFTVDTAGPVIEVGAPVTNQQLGNSIAVRARVSDGQSGVREVRTLVWGATKSGERFDSAQELATYDPASNYYSTTITVPDIISHPGRPINIIIRAEDNLGNASVQTIPVILESTPPTGTILINNGAYFTLDQAVDLTLTFNDDISGVAGMQITNDPAAWPEEWLEPSTTVSNHYLNNSDGLQKVFVRFSDQVGNTSSVYSDTITLDTQDPAVVSIDFPVSPTRQLTSIRGTAWDRVSVTAPANPDVSFDVRGGSGVETVKVAIRKNDHPASDYDYSYWQWPTAAGSTGTWIPGGANPASTGVWQEVAPTPDDLDADDYDIWLVNTNLPEIADADDGTVFEIIAKAQDRAGRVSADKTEAITIDRTVQSITVTVNPAVARPNNVISISVVPGEALRGSPEVTVGATATSATFVAYDPDSGSHGTYIYTYTLPSSLTEDAYVINASGYDLAGNGLTGQGTISIDAQLPTLSNLTITPDSPVRAEEVTLILTFNEDMDQNVDPVVTFGKAGSFAQNGPISRGTWSTAREWQATATISSTNLDSAYNDGLNTFRVSGAQDAAGNLMVSNTAYTFEIDTRQPEIDITTPAAQFVNALSNIAVSATDPEQAGYASGVGGQPQIRIRETTSTGDYRYWYSHGSDWGWTPNVTDFNLDQYDGYSLWVALSDANDHLPIVANAEQYQISASVSDAAGNTAIDSVDFTITIDTSAPEITAVSATGIFSPNGDGEQDTAAISFRLPADATATVQILNGAAVIQTWTNVTADVVWDGKDAADHFVAEGNYAYQIRATDGAGNLAVPVNGLITVDLSAPTGGLVINSGALVTEERMVNLNITASDNYSALADIDMRLKIDHGEWTSWRSYSATYLRTLPDTNGPHTISVQLKDAVGNISEYADDIILNTLRAPSSLTLVAAGGALRLDWSLLGGLGVGETYRIYQSALPAEFGTVLANPATRSYETAYPAPGALSYYRVVTASGALESAASNIVAAQTFELAASITNVISWPNIDSNLNTLGQISRDIRDGFTPAYGDIVSLTHPASGKTYDYLYLDDWRELNPSARGTIVNASDELRIIVPNRLIWVVVGGAR